MTAEEAIKILKSKMDGSVDTSYEWTEAVRMAIEALQNLSKPNNGLQGSDLIRRSDAIDVWWHDEVFFGGQRDDMTKEQWLDYITDVIGSLPSADVVSKGVFDQFRWERDMAFKTLEEHGIGLGEIVYETTENKSKLDLISRQDVVSEIDEWIQMSTGNGTDMVIKDFLSFLKERIDTLPSAESKTGHWVEIEDYNGDIHYQCDQCGEEFILIDGTPEDNNYWHCPNCGSYNGGGEAVVKGADNESTL